MTGTTSAYGLNIAMVNSLQAQQTTLGQLTQQVSSGKLYDNLTNYNPTDAHNLIDFQNGIIQRQSYISSIQNVQSRLSVYDTSMSDIEKIATQANTLATQNAAYNSTTAANIQQSATNYLRQLTDDLNQQIGGRYVYAGTRYTTAPVIDLSTLTGTPTATTTTSPALPSYDTDYANATSFSINSGKTPSGTFTIGNTTIPWSALEGVGATSPVTVTIGGTPQTIPVTGLSTSATPTAFANNFALTLSAVAASAYASTSGVPSTLTATASSGTITLDYGGAAPTAVTPNAGGTAAQMTWVGGSTPDGTVQQTPNSSVPAYTVDSATIDSNFTVSYGVTSNNPSFQKLVNGLRYINDAVTAGNSGDTATYKSNMQQASLLLSSALAGIVTLHTQVANNQNTLKQEVITQNSDITVLQTQISSIQKVDLTKVGSEINLLQTQLQASYSATSSLEKLSLVKYL